MTQVFPTSVLETAEVERGYTVKRIWKPLEYTRRWFLCGETNSRQIAQTGRNIKKHPSSSLFYRKESKVKKLSRQRFFRVLQQLTVIQASEIISWILPTLSPKTTLSMIIMYLIFPWGVSFSLSVIKFWCSHTKHPPDTNLLSGSKHMTSD